MTHEVTPTTVSCTDWKNVRSGLTMVSWLPLLLTLVSLKRPMQPFCRPTTPWSLPSCLLKYLCAHAYVAVVDMGGGWLIWVGGRVKYRGYGWQWLIRVGGSG